MNIVASSAPRSAIAHHGHRLDHEFAGGGLGHVRAGCAGSPPLPRAGQIAYETGKFALSEVWEDPEAVRHPDAKGIENCIVVNSAIGGSTKPPIHINALARISASNSTRRTGRNRPRDSAMVTCSRPLLPSARNIIARRRAGGGARMMAHKRIHEDAMTMATPMGDNCRESAEARWRRHLDL